MGAKPGNGRKFRPPISAWSPLCTVAPWRRQGPRPEFAAKFPTAKHFGSWLGLCPDNRITGGKIYSVKTRAVKSRVAEALRLAAQSLWRAQNYFGDLYRRWKARLGSPKA